MRLSDSEIKQIIENSTAWWQKCYCSETGQYRPYGNYHNVDDLREIEKHREGHKSAIQKAWDAGYTRGMECARNAMVASSDEAEEFATERLESVSDGDQT